MDVKINNKEVTTREELKVKDNVRGWIDAKVAAYNKSRFDGFIPENPTSEQVVKLNPQNEEKRFVLIPQDNENSKFSNFDGFKAPEKTMDEKIAEYKKIHGANKNTSFSSVDGFKKAPEVLVKSQASIERAAKIAEITKPTQDQIERNKYNQLPGFDSKPFDGIRKESEEELVLPKFLRDKIEKKRLESEKETELTSTEEKAPAQRQSRAAEIKSKFDQYKGEVEDKQSNTQEELVLPKFLRDKIEKKRLGSENAENKSNQIESQPNDYQNTIQNVINKLNEPSIIEEKEGKYVLEAEPNAYQTNIQNIINSLSQKANIQTNLINPQLDNPQFNNRKLAEISNNSPIDSNNRLFDGGFVKFNGFESLQNDAGFDILREKQAIWQKREAWRKSLITNIWQPAKKNVKNTLFNLFNRGKSFLKNFEKPKINTANTTRVLSDIVSNFMANVTNNAKKLSPVLVSAQDGIRSTINRMANNRSKTPREVRPSNTLTQIINSRKSKE